MPVRWNGRRSRNFWNLRRACSVLVMCSWFTAQDFTSRFLLHLGFYPLKAYPCMVIRVLRQSVAFSTWYTDVEMLADIYLSGSRRDSSPHCDSRRAVVHHLQVRQIWPLPHSTDPTSIVLIDLKVREKNESSASSCHRIQEFCRSCNTGALEGFVVDRNRHELHDTPC